MTDASPQSPHDEQDASMDTILASIRRIIMEDEAGAHPGEGGHDAEDDLLVLQPSMIVNPEAAGIGAGGAQSAADLAAALFDDPEPPKPVPLPVAVTVPPPVAEPVAAPIPVEIPVLAAAPPPALPAETAAEPLLAPAASLAAAHALASLQEAMRPEPPPPSTGPRLLRSGGPTIEDMVREELRGQLKEWLDANLPSLVERLVAQEIGRLVHRG